MNRTLIFRTKGRWRGSCGAQATVDARNLLGALLVVLTILAGHLLPWAGLP